MKRSKRIIIEALSSIMKDPFEFQNLDAAAILLQNGYSPCKEGLEFYKIQYEEYMSHTPKTR